MTHQQTPKPDRAAEILEHALTLQDTERSEYLNSACAGDASLRSEVESLLKAHDEQGEFLASPSHGGAAAAGEAAANAVTAERSSSSESVGAMIDRYKLLQLIGEGGFGAVYMAEQREPVQRKVALKIIKLGMDTRQVIARFEAERQALAMMDHPNIAKVLDAGATSGGRPYFVMELVRGEPITQYCDKNNLTVDQRLGLFQQVCHAVQHAHQKGIIHRDIKPSNVMITLHDGQPIPKVIDFGIAKATSARLTEKTVFTEYRQFIGTPEYMSPEQAEMSGIDIDTRSDVYSLGVLLYELLTGTTPFDSQKLRSAGYGEIQRIIREETPHKPSTRLSTLDTLPSIAAHRHTEPKKLGTMIRGDLDWIVMKALEKDRTRRYETANGFAMDVERYLNDEPVTATPPSASYKLKKLIKRNKGAFAAAAIVFVTLTLGVIGTSWGLVSTRAEYQRAERELTRANEVKRLMTEMFNVVSPEHAKGTDITLLKGILDATAERLAADEIADELIAAELRGVIGHVYRELGLYDAAERHIPVSLEVRERWLGPDHPDTLWAKAELATLLAQQSRSADAEVLFADIVDRGKRVMGESAPLTLLMMHNLADTYRNLGRYNDAERLLRDLLAIQKRTPGADPTVGLMVLGNLFQELSRYAEAESVFLELIEHMRQLGRGEHPHTIGAMQNLAITYSHRKRYDEAAAIYEEVLPVARRVLGPGHDTTVRILVNLGYVRVHQGRLQDADEALTEALQRCRDLFGDNPHRLTLETSSVIITLRVKQNRNTEAEALHRDLIDGRKKIFGLKHKDTLAAMTNYGYFLNRQERYPEALEMLETTVPLKLEVLGRDHLFTRIATRELARAYEALEQPQDAIPPWGELLDYQVRTLDQDDSSALNGIAWDLLTFKYEELHDPERALPLAQRACALEEANGGANLWMYLDTLAKAQHMTGDTAAAVETQIRALSLMPAGSAARAEIEQRLAEYEAALAAQSAGDEPELTND